MLPPKHENEIVPAEPLVPAGQTWLSAGEQFALQNFRRKLGHGGSQNFPLAESMATGMFVLFLNGKSLSEIRAMNPHIGLGQIVHTAVEGHWNELRQAHLDTVVARAKSRAVQAAAESVEFTADLMAAVRALHGPNIARFLQSGRQEDLGAATSMSVIRQVKELAELLMKLTGQDQKKNVSGTIKHEVTGSVTTVPLQAPPQMPTGFHSGVLSSWAAAETERQRLERESS